MVTVITCKAKKWGSSLGVVIPKEVVEKEQIVPGGTVVMEIKGRVRAGELFGIAPEWKGRADEIKKEMKRGWK